MATIASPQPLPQSHPPKQAPIASSSARAPSSLGKRKCRARTEGQSFYYLPPATPRVPKKKRVVSRKSPHEASTNQPVVPRWHNATFFLYRALQNSGSGMSKKRLMEAAVRLDAQSACETSLPRVFPDNVDMALKLTTKTIKANLGSVFNKQSKFVYSLAFSPCDFDAAVANYWRWMKLLVENDWPKCFGRHSVFKKPVSQSADDLYDTFEAAKDEPLKLQALNRELNAPAWARAALETAQKRIESSCNPQRKASAFRTDGETVEIFEPSESVPTVWQDILYVAPSTIPNAGMGLFARRDIPRKTPLGFYFGVPTSEADFDLRKNSVGMASHYSIMYRSTVLDATDDQGMPYNDPAKEKQTIYCPFHFLNELSGKNRTKNNCAFVEGVVVNQVIVVCRKDVKADEELFVNYGDEVDRSHYGTINAPPPPGAASSEHKSHKENTSD